MAAPISIVADVFQINIDVTFILILDMYIYIYDNTYMCVTK